MVSMKINDCEIIVTEGDISQSGCQAIVNAANNHLWMGSGVAGAIKRNGGQQIEDEAVRLGPVQVGQAVVTSAGNLKADFVIHGAVMGQDLSTDKTKIRKTTRNSLMRATELGIESVAFPAFGTGVGGFSLGECADVMLSETIDYLKVNGAPPRVEFVLFGKEAYDAFADKLNSFNS